MTPAALALRPVTRSVRWAPLLGAGLLGAGVIWLLRPERPDLAASVGGLRLAAFLLCAGAAFALDDEAADTLAPSPTPLLARRGLRLAAVVAVAGSLWAGLALAAGLAAPAGQDPVPVGAATLEAAALLAFTLAATLVAAPWAPRHLGGVAGAPTLTVAVLAAYLGQMRWPRHLTLFPFTPDDPAWAVAHRRWAVVLVVAVAALLVASLDPARRRLRSRHGVRARSRHGVRARSRHGVQARSRHGVRARSRG